MPNHLEGQMSPYLLQHADNPVNWYPWCEEAFARACYSHFHDLDRQCAGDEDDDALLPRYATPAVRDVRDFKSYLSADTRNLGQSIHEKIIYQSRLDRAVCPESRHLIS